MYMYVSCKQPLYQVRACITPHIWNVSRRNRSSLEIKKFKIMSSDSISDWSEHLFLNCFLHYHSDLVEKTEDYFLFRPSVTVFDKSHCTCIWISIVADNEQYTSYIIHPKKEHFLIAVFMWRIATCKTFTVNIIIMFCQGTKSVAQRRNRTEDRAG